MMRGNQYLEFESDQSVGNDHPRPARYQRQAPPGNDDAGLGWLFVLILLVAPVIAGLGTLANKSPAPAAAARVESPASQAREGTARHGRAQEAAPPEGIAPQVVQQAPKAVHRFWATPGDALYVRALDGRTYRVESRTTGAVEGSLPPGFRFGRAPSRIFLWDAPLGNVLRRIPEGIAFLYTAEIYRKPYWRWMVSLDGAYQGYIFLPDEDRDQSAAMREAALYSLALAEERIPLAPPGYGCASVAGIIERLAVGGEFPRKYELPLCGNAALSRNFNEPSL